MRAGDGACPDWWDQPVLQHQHPHGKLVEPRTTGAPGANGAAPERAAPPGNHSPTVTSVRPNSVPVGEGTKPPTFFCCAV